MIQASRQESDLHIIIIRSAAGRHIRSVQQHYNTSRLAQLCKQLDMALTLHEQVGIL